MALDRQLGKHQAPLCSYGCVGNCLNFTFHIFIRARLPTNMEGPYSRLHIVLHIVLHIAPYELISHELVMSYVGGWLPLHSHHPSLLNTHTTDHQLPVSAHTLVISECSLNLQSKLTNYTVYAYEL